MTLAVAPLPPGPQTPAVWQLLRYSHSPLPFLEASARRFGDPFTLQFAGYGTFVMLASPDAVQDVFRGDPHTLHSGETADETGKRARESAGTVRHFVWHVAARNLRELVRHHAVQIC